MNRPIVYLVSLMICMLGSYGDSFADSCVAIGTQNLWHYSTDYEKRSANLKSELGSMDFVPEIVGFQEAWTWWGKMSLYQDFLDLTGYSSFFHKTNAWVIMQEGLALASSLKGRDFKAQALPHDEIQARRMLVSGIYETPIGPLRVINVHLTPGGYDKRDARKDQVAFLVEYARRESVPTVFLGDFNDSPSSGIFEPLKAAGYREVHEGPLSTFDPANPYCDAGAPMRFDYIFYPEEWLQVDTSGLMFEKNPISDHYGVKARICQASNR